MSNEKLALEIAFVLKKKCPAFKYKESRTAIWHGCDCLVDGESCVCVWHLVSECNGGRWKELDFVDEYHSKEQSKRDAMLDKVIKARSA